MATVAKDHTDDETQLGDPGQTSQEAQVAPLGQTAQAAPDTGAGASPHAAPQSTPQGRFMDIQRLLNANKGQGAGLAQRAVSTADRYAGLAQQQLGQAQTAYQQQVKAGTPTAFNYTSPTPAAPPPPPSIPALTGWGMPASSGLARAPAASPNYSGLPTDPAAAQNAATATYTGPHSLADTRGVDLAALNQSAQQAQQAGQALGSESGVSTLLGTGGGMGALDAALAFGEGGSALRSAAPRFGSILDQLRTAQGDTSAADAAQASATKTAAAGNQALADQAAQATQTQLDQQRAADDAVRQQQEDESLGQWFASYFGNASSPMMGPASSMGFTSAPPALGTDAYRQWVSANRDVIKRLQARAGVH